MSTPLSTYSSAFDTMADGAIDGHTSMEFQFSFWEKLYKLQTSYAKNLDDLCNSRAAKLHKLFSTQTCEPNEPLDAAWSSMMVQIQAHAEQLRKSAKVIHDDVCGPLFRYTHHKAPTQLENVNMGRRVLRDLKVAESKLTADKRRYENSVAALRKVNANHLERAQAAVVRDEAAYKQSLANYEQLHRQSFDTALPNVLQGIDEHEVARVETCKSSTLTALQLLNTTDPTILDQASTAMTAVTRSDVSTAVAAPVPTVPTLELLPTDIPEESPVPKQDSAASVDAPSATEAAAPPSPSKRSGRGFFSSLFGGGKTEESVSAGGGKAEESVSAATEPSGNGATAAEVAVPKIEDNEADTSQEQAAEEAQQAPDNPEDQAEEESNDPEHEPEPEVETLEETKETAVSTEPEAEQAEVPEPVEVEVQPNSSGVAADTDEATAESAAEESTVAVEVAEGDDTAPAAHENSQEDPSEQADGTVDGVSEQPAPEQPAPEQPAPEQQQEADESSEDETW
eukprot:m.84140 g.84140  ORF g.84140 m.84140 type:complete len:511 (+) comp14679_c0_seq3:90-1622(+)